MMQHIYAARIWAWGWLEGFAYRVHRKARERCAETFMEACRLGHTAED